MRASRVFRMILSIFIYILTLSMSLTSFLAGYSAVQILTDPDNIEVPYGDVEYNIDIYDPNNMSIEVPYKITNAGYFNLEDMYIKIKIYLNYFSISEQEEDKVKLFSKKHTIDLIARGETEKGKFKADSDDFDIGEIILIFPDINLTKDIEYTADIEFFGKYGVQLYWFTVKLEDVNLGDYEAEEGG